MKKITLLFLFLLTLSFGNSQTTYYPVYDGIFGGATYAQTFTFPTGAEGWAGFANNNTSIYPLSFPNAGQVTFKATVAVDAQVYFRFEANPHPAVDPAINTANVQLLASNGEAFEYSVDIPGNATNTYNSAIFYVVTQDVDVNLSEIKINTYDTDGIAVLKSDSPVYDGMFGGATYAQTYSFPTGAEGWAGFANNNTSIYPLSFPNGAQVTFKATVATDAEVYFRFEANPHPAVDPAINTANVQLLASNGEAFEYSVDIPANATNTYNSAIFYVVTRDVDVILSETKIIKVDVNPLTDVTLSDLTVDGQTVTDFSAGTLTYDIGLPLGTTTVPTVVGTPTQSSPAIAVTTDASELPGTTTVLVTAQDGITEQTYSINFKVLGENLALNKTATASSTEGAFTANLAVDGNLDVASRWGSNFEDPSWIYVDLGDEFAIDVVKIYWEAAYGKDYTIDLSEDAISWTTVNTVTDGNGGEDYLSFTPTNGRYVRMHGTARGTVYGYGVIELEVYGGAALNLENLEKINFSIYPNPSLDAWNIKTNNTVINAVKVFDILGKQVISLSPESTEVKIDGSSLTSGIYIAKIATAQGVSNVRLVRK